MARLIRGTSKNARFFITDTTDLIQKAMDTHNYDVVSMDIFGKFCTLAVLLGSTLKGNDKLTIRTDTEGYIKNIIVNSDGKGNIKGYLVNETGDYDKVGKGMMRIIKDMGLKEPYIGITQIDYTKLANDISYYFYNSEQVPTVIAFAMDFTNDNRVLCAGAYMIQVLPNADENFVEKLERKVQAIRPMNELMKGGMSLERIANLLYDDMETEDDSLVEEYQILEGREVKYECDCSSDRFYRGLLTLGKDELKKIFEEEGNIETECQFCNKKYKFEKENFKEIF